MAPSSMKLKLLIDTEGKKILFAEAGKDFVDFLFGVLTLPLGSIISVFGKQATESSLPNLYASIENLNESYIQPNQTKDTLLKPVPSMISGSSVPLLGLNDAPNANQTYYFCAQCKIHVSHEKNTVCPNCKQYMVGQLAHIAPPAVKHGSGEGGFVQGKITYMVMDNLDVTPLSTISCITLLKNFDVKEVSKLEEKVVDFGMDEAMKLLNASFHSKTVLTDVFLKGRLK